MFVAGLNLGNIPNFGEVKKEPVKELKPLNPELDKKMAMELLGLNCKTQSKNGEYYGFTPNGFHVKNGLSEVK